MGMAYSIPAATYQQALIAVRTKQHKVQFHQLLRRCCVQAGEGLGGRDHLAELGQNMGQRRCCHSAWRLRLRCGAFMVSILSRVGGLVSTSDSHEDSGFSDTGARSLVGLVDPKIERVLELARRHLQMDVSFLSEFSGGKQIYREVDGQADSFGIVLGEGPELPTTYCQKMIDGVLPNAVPDSRADHRVQGLTTTIERGIGSYVGVPLRLSDGSLYGTFCCMSHGPESLTGRDVAFMAMLADVLVEALDAQRLIERERDLITEILATRSVESVFQPIMDLRGGGIVGFEALSRFPQARNTPGEVFDSAHSVGLGIELEALALGNAVRFLGQIPADAYLAVNLSPVTALVLTEELFGRVDVDLNRLVLEVTETAAVAGYEELRSSLGPLREQGLRVAIDDAGAGFASLHHIVELRPDVIKVDKSLIQGMAADSSRRSAARAFVALADDLGAVTVAEGVETPPDLDAARALGITCAQGYLIGRPAPI